MSMTRALHLMTCTIALAHPPVAHAAGAASTALAIRQELADARLEVRTDLAAARVELASGNLELAKARVGANAEEDGSTVRRSGNHARRRLLIDGVAVDLTRASARAADYRAR